MIYQGVVDSEGGELVIGDVIELQQWSGAIVDRPDFAEISATLLEKQGMNVTGRGRQFVLWDCGGPGTTDVFLNEATAYLLLVRAWLDDLDDEDAEVALLSRLPLQVTTPFAEMTVTTGVVGILWSVETGASILRSPDGGWSLNKAELMTESTGLLLALPPCDYQCFHDAVETSRGTAWRCHIVRKSE